MIPPRPLDYFNSVLAMILGAAVPVVVLATPLPPGVIAFARAGLAVIIMVIFAAITLQFPSAIKFRDWPRIVLSGMCVAGCWLCFFLAIKTAGVASAQGCMAVYPLLTLLIAPLFDKAGSGHIAYYGLALIALIGIVLTLPNFDVRQPENLGTLYALAAAVLLALSGHIVRRVYQLNPMDRTANGIIVIQMTATTLALAPMLAVTPAPLRSIFTWSTGGNLLLLGLVFTGLYRILTSGSARRVPLDKSNLIHACEPYIAIALAWAIVGQAPSLRVMGGVALITLVVLAAVTMQRVGPANVFRPIRWN